jgi:cyclic-di-GMP-binding protein
MTIGMNEAYQRLRDDLPARRAPDAAAFPTDPRRLRAWVDALPRANQQATLRQLIEALAALSGLKLDGPQRLLAMEVLRPSVLEGVVALDKLLQGSSFPLPAAKVQVADLIQTFQRELAFAYRLALVELCAPSGAVPFLKGAQVSLALERAIYHASRDLAASYFMYRAPRAGSWSAMNALYRFGQSVRLEDKPVEEPLERIPLSPRQTYAQALLLALSNPYRFTQREQAELWPVTRDLAAHVELLPRRPGEDAFAVAQQDDRGPGYLPEERDASGALLWLNLAPLREALDAPLRGGAGGPVHVRFRQGHTIVASAEVLRRMRAGWGHSAARGHSRLGAAHSLDTVIGLAGLHYYLSGHLDFDTFMRQVRGVAAHDSSTERAVWAQNGVDVGRAPVLRARVLDQSLGGYRLSWSHKDSVRARVGELVGVALPGEEAERDWMVGVIRWLRYDPQGDVDAGVELLARRAHAVGLRCLDLPGAPRPPLRAIQIDCLRANGKQALHFLAPAVIDASAARIEVARALEPDEFDSEGVPLEQCSDILVLENAGDYLLLAAHPLGHA